MTDRRKNRGPAVEADAFERAAIGGDNVADVRIELRRDGRAPFSFRGMLLCETTSYSPGPALWYDIGIYAVSEGGYAVAIHTYKKAVGERDLHRAERFERMPDVVSFLETFDAAEDVTVGPDTIDDRLSTAEMMLRAVALRQRITEARSEYRAAAGEILTQLDGLL